MLNGELGDKNSSSEPDIEEESETSVGITVIDSIVTKVTSGILDPSQTLNAIKQILFFYKLIPRKWRRKAFFVFAKLWDKKQVVMSTDVEAPQQIYETSFDDGRINSILECLPESDKAIMYEGKAMLDLISRGLHSSSDEIKKDVKSVYGKRGLNIANIITTGDINYLLEDISNHSNREEVLKVFNYWVDNYRDIALLLSKTPDMKTIKKEIIRMVKAIKKDYILIHFTGPFRDMTVVQTVLSELFEKKKIIKYTLMEMDIQESGFRKALNVKINFK